MRSKHNFLNNSFDTIAFNVGNFLYLGSQWLISVALVRLGGFEDAGLFSLAMTVCNVLVVVSNYGLRTFHISDVKNKFSDFTYIATRYFTMALALVLCVGFTLIKGYDFIVQVCIWVYMLYKTIEAYSDVLNCIWQKSEGMKNVGISFAAKGILNTISFLGVYTITGNLLLSFISMSISSFVVLLLFDVKITKRYVCRKNALKNIEKSQCALLLKQGFMTMVSTMCIILFNSIPKLLIDDMLDTELLGVFSSIATPTVVISTFAIGVLLPIAPKMAGAYEDGNIKKLMKLIVGCDVVIIGVGVLATVFSFIAGQFVFELVFGEEIIPYFNLFYWMIWVSVLIAMVNSYTTVLIAIRKLKQLLFFSVIACVLEWVLCIIFISEKGIYGAAYAMLLALVIQFVTETIYIIYLLNKRKKWCENE